jgi:hypothetical protein
LAGVAAVTIARCTDSRFGLHRSMAAKAP